MGKELTEADMASYLVQFGVEGMSPRMIEAAYATTDSGSASISASQGTGFVYFKDWQHKVVAMVQANTVVLIERQEPKVAVDAGGVELQALTADDGMTPGQICKLQDALNAAAQKLNYTKRITVLPCGSKVSRRVPEPRAHGSGSASTSS